MLNRFTVSCSLLAAAVAFSAAATRAGLPAPPGKAPGGPSVGSLFGVNENLPPYAAGQVVVRFAPGADAAALAAQAGLTVERRLRFAPNTYVLGGLSGSPVDAAAALRHVPGVVAAAPNLNFRPTALPDVQPDDQFYSQQWALRAINAPDAWGITVGERLVGGPVKTAVVGVIDSGFETSHPDLQENIDPNGFDFVRQQPYNEADIATLGSFSHGTAVSGCIAAVTNNEEGIAGLPWEAVRILPCHAGDLVRFGTNLIEEPLLQSAEIVDAIYYCIQQNVDVINMSFGFPTTGPPVDDPLIDQAVSDAYDQGIVLVAASGNGRLTFGTFVRTSVAYPANLPQVIPVGAVGSSGELAFYSDGGKEMSRGLVAPGGNDTTFFDAGRQVLTTDSSFFFFNSTGTGYAYDQGTSLAAGFVSSAAAVLITQGALETPAGATDLTPQARVELMRALLTGTARSPFGGVNNDYGNGILDVGAALRQITQVIDVASPVENQVTESFSEPLEARIAYPINQPLSAGAFTVTQDDDNPATVPIDVTNLVNIVDENAGLIEYQPDTATRYSIGNNRFNIIVDNPLHPGLVRSLESASDGHLPAQAFRFRVIPHLEHPGLKMLSIPYALTGEAQSLSFLTGGNLVRLARWLPDQNRYAIFDIVGSPQDPEASLTTDAAGVARPPIGVGFWSRIVSETQFQVLGQAETTGSYEIPLKPGFNMIGDPYSFRVPFNVLSVRHGNVVMSISDAVKQNLIRPTIWRYQDGRYALQSLPFGELVEWESHWVRALDNITLIIPRLPSSPTGNVGAAAPASPRRAAAAGWNSSIRAATRGASFGEVTLGAARDARDGYDDRDVETPPAALTGDLRVAHRDWGRLSGGYARDIRGANGRVQTWSVEVATSKPGEPVKLTWDRFPAGTRATMRVEGSGKVYDLTAAGSAQFKAPRSGTARVTVVALAAAVRV